MAEIFEGLDKMLEGEEGENFYRQILVYLFSTTEYLKEMEILDQLSKTPHKSRKMRMTIAEQLRQEGMEKGIEKGIEKGMEKGIEKGMEKVAKTMKSKGYAAEEIHALTGLPLDKIKDL